MGVFEFIIALVVISTVDKVVRHRREIPPMDKSTSQIGPGAFEGLRDTVDEMNTRLERIEEERNFTATYSNRPSDLMRFPLPSVT